MGKIGNVLTMLKILENGQKYTVKELAERLEVSKRMIKIYKSELEKAGIYIETLFKNLLLINCLKDICPLGS